MKIAIYSRKSKFTEKGESIENQIKLCKEYAINHFGAGENDISVYEDEGFSGGNIDRPEFQLMLKDAKEKKFQVLVCYRLDRVSRNISDFSSFIDYLEKLGVSFVSLREQFDTSTPMGRAMMYIASVFAQLERETIAERIRDNMLQLSKTGRWLGGNAPTGFKSEPVEVLDRHGVSKKAFKLVPIEKEVSLVKLLYSKYIELNSLRKLESYCVQNDIKSKNNRKLSRFALTGILSNPVYVKADEQVYNYFIANGYAVYSDKTDFNSINGVMTYNKVNESTQKTRDISDWIIAIGAHEGIIDAAEWLKVQSMFNENKDKTFRKVRNSHSLLSGVLRCAKCGSPMRPKATGRSKKYGEHAFTYMCELKEVSKKTKCNVKNVNGNEFDDIVVSEIKKMSLETSMINKDLRIEEEKRETAAGSLKKEISLVDDKIKANELSIKNLIESIETGSPSQGTQYILKRIDELDALNIVLKGNLLELQAMLENKVQETDSISVASNMLDRFPTLIDNATVEEKRRILRTIVRNLTWDGEHIDIGLFGMPDEKRSPFSIPLSDTCR